MKALSVRAPWWWFILHAGKDIENRDWPTKHRGPLLIHASSWHSAGEISRDFQWAIEEFPDLVASLSAENPPPSVAQFKRLGGHIVGIVEIDDCVEASESPWFQGQYGFVLEKPMALRSPIRFKGRLGLFDVPAPLELGPRLERG